MKHLPMWKKRWNLFRANRISWFAFLFFLIMLMLTLLAPVIANNRPVILKYHGSWFFPVFVNYHPSLFGVENAFVMDYQKSLDPARIQFRLNPLYSFGPLESNKEVSIYPSPPTPQNILGTDEAGRDVFARLLYGFYYGIVYALCTWLVSYFLGITAGALMGYFGGKVDFLGQRFVEILSSIPTLFLLLILIATFSPNIYWLIFFSSLFGWVGISYYVRGEFLKLKSQEFVEAARAMGQSRLKIIFIHLLPNSLGPVITFSPFFIAGQIAGLASLDYLGLGLPIPTPSWGELLSQAYKYFATAWWLALFPSLALFTTLLLLTFIGEGVRDAFDPKK